MTGTTTGQTALPTATDSDDNDNYLTVSLVAALQALANLFESGTGHDHSGSGKGKPIASAGIASGAITPPMMAATAFTAFTPTLAQNAAVTIATNWAAYLLLGKLAVVNIQVTATATGTIANPIVLASLPAPITVKNTGGQATVGSFTYLRTGVIIYAGSAIAATGTTIQLQSTGNVDRLGNTNGPSFAVAIGDILSMTLMYEVA